jgi:hypothetical protein
LENTEFKQQYQSCLSSANENNVLVSQVDSLSLGGRGSESEAMQNPRMFVMDANNNVTLPLVLQEEQKAGERCNVYKDQNGIQVTNDCYPVTKQITTFAGLKSFSFDKTNGIDEKFSVDYFKLFDTLYGHKDTEDYYSNIDYRSIQGTDMRVGFAGDALYMLNNDFAHFIVPGHEGEKYMYFDGGLTK